MPINPSTRAFLDSLRIASPCDAPWSAMAGDDRVRRCAQCDRKVYNAANLRAEELAALFQTGQPLPCLQLWRRADGTVITADCPVGARRLRARRRVPVALTLSTMLSTLLAACTQTRPLIQTTGLVVGEPASMTGGAPAVVGRTRPKPAPSGPKAPPPLTGTVSAPVRPVMGKVSMAPTPKGQPPTR